MKNSYLINDTFQSFLPHLLEIEKLFTTTSHTIHKARNELKVVEIDNAKYVVKSFKVPHLLNRIFYSFFRHSKAKKSYLNGEKLITLGISTPQPVGVIEFFSHTLLEKSFYVSLYHPYDFTIREVIHHKIPAYKTILEAFAKFTATLHEKGVWHEDYSLGNILITQQNNTYQFALVDINRMQFKTIAPYEGLKNLNKLWIQTEEDMKIIASTYADQRNIDADKAFFILKTEQEKIKNFKKRKNILKKMVGKS